MGIGKERVPNNILCWPVTNVGKFADQAYDKVKNYQKNKSEPGAETLNVVHTIEKTWNLVLSALLNIGNHQGE